MCPVDLTVHDDMTQCECPVCSMVRYTPGEGPQTLGVPLYLAHCVVVPWPISQDASRMQEGHLRSFAFPTARNGTSSFLVHHYASLK